MNLRLCVGWLVLSLACSRALPASKPAQTAVVSARETDRRAQVAVPETVSAEAAPAYPPLSAETAPARSEQGCGIRIEPGAPGDPSGESPELEDCHALSFAWKPWWLAPDPAAGPHRVMIGIDAARRIAERGYQVWISLRYLAPDEQPESKPRAHVLLFQGMLYTYDTGEVFVEARFDDPALAATLHVPPGSDGQPARGFVLSLGKSQSGLWAELSSQRREISCTVLRLEPQLADPECRGLMDDFELASKKIELDSAVTPSFKPRAMLKVLDRSGPATIDWGSDPSTASAAPRTSALEISAQPLGYACRAPSEFELVLPEHPSGVVSKVGHDVIMPITLKLKSADGRLDVTLPAHVRTWVPKVGAWDGHIDLVGKMTEVQTLLARGEHVGFAVPKDALAFILATLNRGPEAFAANQLVLQVYRPDPRVPAFPEVSEVSANRAICFGTELASGRREALITFRSAAAEQKR